MPLTRLACNACRNCSARCVRVNGARTRLAVLCVVFAVVLQLAGCNSDAIHVAYAGNVESWQGLVIAPEHRCSPYDVEDYPYPQAIEREIVQGLGKVYGPYTGTCFASPRETDIEHIVARSEAHDSGLCAVGADIRARFARDLRNLTLAAPRLNRHRKRGKDAADWLPKRNRCWFAARVVEVRRAYGLTIDQREAAALERLLSSCASLAMEPLVCVAQADVDDTAEDPQADVHPFELYDDDGNGRITCKEARRHDIAPVSEDHGKHKKVWGNQAAHGSASTRMSPVLSPGYHCSNFPLSVPSRVRVRA